MFDLFEMYLFLDLLNFIFFCKLKKKKRGLKVLKNSSAQRSVKATFRKILSFLSFKKIIFLFRNKLK